jgi:hypothetical protein
MTEFSPNEALSGEETEALALTNSSPDASDPRGSLYTYHDVLVEHGNELCDSEGSRAFVRFARKFLGQFIAERSPKELVRLVKTLLIVWKYKNKGYFRVRREEDESEWVVAKNDKAMRAALKCFVGLREAAKKVGATWPILGDPADESIVDTFWNDNNAALGTM